MDEPVLREEKNDHVSKIVSKLWEGEQNVNDDLEKSKSVSLGESFTTKRKREILSEGEREEKKRGKIVTEDQESEKEEFNILFSRLTLGEPGYNYESLGEPALVAKVDQSEIDKKVPDPVETTTKFTNRDQNNCLRTRSDQYPDQESVMEILTDKKDRRDIYSGDNAKIVQVLAQKIEFDSLDRGPNFGKNFEGIPHCENEAGCTTAVDTAIFSLDLERKSEIGQNCPKRTILKGKMME